MMVAEQTRWQFSVDDFHRMIDSGIIREGTRVELIEGDLIRMAAAGGRHVLYVIRLTDLLNVGLRRRASMSVQNPLRLSPYSEPQPDLALLRPIPPDRRSYLPEAADVLLLIEVSDSSLRFDRGTKLPLYAAAGIPELWILDVDHERIEVYRDPMDGRYRTTQVVERGGQLAPVAFPDLAISVDEIFGASA